MYYVYTYTLYRLYRYIRLYTANMYSLHQKFYTQTNNLICITFYFTSPLKQIPSATQWFHKRHVGNLSSSRTSKRQRLSLNKLNRFNSQTHFILNQIT